MLVDANNMRSNVNGGHTLVGCAMRTVTYTLTRAMVRRAHPTIVVYFYFDLSCRRIRLTNPCSLNYSI